MKFDPKTDQQLQQLEEENLLPAGVYDFEVLSAEDTHSSKGNEMAVVKLQISSPDGRERTVIDYLVSTDAMAFKIKHFAESVGLMGEYQSGELAAEDMKGCVGQCKIIITPAKGEYRAKNTVADYVKKSGANSGSKPIGDPRPAPPPLDDDIPF